ALVDAGHGRETYRRATVAAGKLARAVPNEVRLHLARGLDRVWDAPSTEDGTCHHHTALQLAIETMRDSAFGAWDPDTERRQVIVLADPVAQSLTGMPDDAIHFGRLDAAIRALAQAAKARICVSALAAA